MTFDLWIDDEGRPPRFTGSQIRVPGDPEHPEVAVATTRDYSYEERDSHIPEESEILPERPSPGA